MTMTPKSNNESKNPFKRTYNKPILNIYGSVTSLTAAGPTGSVEDNPGASGPKCDSATNKSRTVVCP